MKPTQRLPEPSQLAAAELSAPERRLFFDRMDDRYAELRLDSEVWSEIESERVVEDGAIGDFSD